MDSLRTGVVGRARRLALVAGLALTAGAPLGARAQASLCPAAGTLADLVALGGTGCTVGDKLFSFFGSTITSTGFATPLTEASISYSIINPNAYTEGFLFSAAWAAPAGGTLDESFRYRVTTLGDPITDIHLSQFGEDAFGPNPSGFVSIAEDVCAGSVWFPGGCAGGTVYSLSTFFSHDEALYGPNNHVSQAVFAPSVSTIDVQKDIQVFGGSGGATFSLMDQYVTQTPEPATYAMLGTGLLALGAAVRRRRDG